MALNFPDNPTTGQLYTDFTAGFTYEWDGVVWKSYTAAAAANIRIIDDIESSFNGSTTTFALTSSGAPVTPVSPQQLRIVLGGIVQEPAVDYNIAGSNIIFTTAPTTGLSFSGVLLGSAISPVGLASTGSVYYRQSYSPTGIQTTFTVSGGYRVGYLDVYHNGVKLVVTDDYTATNGSTFDLVTPANNGDTVEAVTFLYTQLYSTTGILDNLFVNGNATVTGITTLGNTVVGGGTTQLLVNGDARVTGILTVGTSSITLDGTNNTINVGTLSISQSGISGGTPDVTARNISGVAATFTGNVSIGGTLTYEDVTNVDSVGLITARSGIVLTGGNATLGTGVTISGSTANTFTLSTNGSERVRVDSSGRLGVGTPAPARQLDIYDATAPTFALHNATSGTGNSDGFLMFTLGSDTTLFNYENGYMAFGTNGIERARIAGTGAFGLSGANYGTSGQVLTSQGSAAAPQWASPATGAMVFISSVTANNSASVAFTSGIDSTYDIYVFTYTGLECSSSQASLEMRFSTNGGSSYFSGAGDYYFSLSRNVLAIATSSSGTSGIRISNNVRTSIDNTPYSGLVYLHNASVSGKHTGVFYFGSELDTPGDLHGAGRSNAMGTGVVNAVQFIMNTGNISAGTFRLYGIKNS